jgi:hypothetical protein
VPLKYREEIDYCKRNTYLQTQKKKNGETQTAAQEMKGYKNKEEHKEWFDYECMQALDIRNKTRMKMLW